MIQNNQNHYYQLQVLLTQISNHVNQINGIIMEMNNLINQINNPMNNPMINQMNNLMNSMNNYMNIDNQINYNNNNLNYIFKEENKEKIDLNDIWNITFIQGNGYKVLVNIKPEQTINELINLYLQKVGLSNLMNSYKEKYTFLFNGLDLYNSKTKKVGELLNDFAKVNIYKKNDVI